MAKSVAEKMGIKENARAIFIGETAEALKAIDAPTLNESKRLVGNFDFIHFFTIKQTALESKFPKLKAHLSEKGTLWISWPKGGQQKTDLNLKSVIGIGYSHGLVESKTLSINDTWSAIKFTHPKKGKVYKNSYGKLKRQALS